eukprot:CAMPEP_0205832768 /NCGR_PEP_ID=MMETSP0206-20130828/47842_1 /ASSEMBLY_ACC=CAM_ASM_000279 /TAXON_ID=36767 /ORGANISM="Euplotes focardii, Strain TN1" /LENGTH=145 /DNA_ID=CAMNT_0053138589 /DNA_START=376 /DNA_END=813 /DNA_ORIENTATION=-
MMEIRKKLMSLSNEMEHQFDRMTKILTPIQQAKFVVYIDKVKHKKELSIFELWGVKRSGFKITKRVKKDFKNFPVINTEYGIIVGKKQFVPQEEEKKEEIKILNLKNESSNEHQMPKLSQDSYESNDIEMSIDSGCPESDTEEVE